MHEQHKAICEELGDRAGVAAACGNLGNCFLGTRDYALAREMHEQHRAIAEAVGDRAGVARAYGGLGICYGLTADYTRAREMHELHKAMAEELGDRAMVARACAGLGNSFMKNGEYARAREMYEQDRAMSEELGDRAGVAAACSGLGNCYLSTGDYTRAREMHEQHKAISEAISDRKGACTACCNLGNCYARTGDYECAISYYKEQLKLAQEMQVGKDQADATLNIGIALGLEVRANLRGRAAGASQLPGLDSSALACRDDACRDDACRDDAVREAEKWLQTARDDGGLAAARLHLAHVAFATGREDTALAHLQGYVSWCVGRGRNLCAGCEQTRDEDAQMLTCGGCRVARFCNADHQKMASKSVASGGGLLHGRHRDLCGVLGKWRRQVVKDGMSPDSCRADLLAFLQQLSEDLTP
jgi:tetratricopeptide (TPR) repeat protein